MSALPLLSVAAGSAWDGSKLYAACQKPEPLRPNGDCAVYIRAVIDRYHEGIASRCPHTETSFGEIARGAVAYLEAHRTEWGRPAPDLILASIKERYGCGPH